jgi:hypothetical protein
MLFVFGSWPVVMVVRPVSRIWCFVHTNAAASCVRLTNKCVRTADGVLPIETVRVPSAREAKY